MHFWNKLSTAALMRLSILAALNLLLVRVVDEGQTLLHPWFFLILVTLNLGLYAVMVYSGTLNLTLIGMMLGGLAATLGTLAYAGMDPRAFMFGGPFRWIGRLVESLLAQGLVYLQVRPPPPRWRGPLGLTGEQVVLIGYLVIDVVGLILILAGGWLGRRLRTKMQRCNAPTSSP